jgi:hypothetical protein
MSVNTNTQMYAQMGISVHSSIEFDRLCVRCACMYVNVHVCCVCVYIYIYIYIYIYTHTHIYIHINIHVHIRASESVGVCNAMCHMYTPVPVHACATSYMHIALRLAK